MNAEINKPGHRGLTHILKALGYSRQGLTAAFKYEEAFRLELLAGVILVPLAFWLAGNGVELAVMLGVLMLVLIVELINSALEAIVDRVGVEHHTLSGRAKDIASAAVMLSMFNVAIVWGAILWYRYS